MKKEHGIEVLKDFGLSDNESQVYFALLSLGPTTVLRIARAAGIKRTTVYPVLDSLKSKGLVNEEVHGSKNKYAAQNPERLESLLDERKKKFEKVLPNFLGMFNQKGGDSTLKHYEGLESLKQVYESMIKDIQPHEEYLVVGNVPLWKSLDEDYFLEDFTFRRSKLPIEIKLLLEVDDEALWFKKYEKNLNAEVRFLPKETKLKTNLVITPQRVFFHQLVEPAVGITIENQEMIKMQQEFFNVMWNAAREE